MKGLIMFTFLSLSSCSYLVKQGIGQVKLSWGAVDNEKILNSEIPEESKRKIRLVQAYKKYFEDYFKVDTGKIYSKTTILNHEAVSFLVIASPYDDIRAQEFEFPFFGKFPYLGFFNKEDALNFARNLEKEDFVTWIRPVYAYSTLGHLNDPILSSFFHYNDVELAELVFHELFHTLFFVPSEVDLNENLANYVGQEMAHQYFGGNELSKEKRSDRQNKEKIFSRLIVQLAHEAKNELKKTKGDKEKSLLLYKNFEQDQLRPRLKEFCGNDPCKWLDYSWNQAKLAAYLTYEEKQDEISGWLEKSSIPLNQLASFLKGHYDDYKKTDKKESFEVYLKGKFNEAHFSYRSH